MFAGLTQAIAGNVAQRWGGIAAGDIDGDGIVELAVCCADGANAVLKWDGSALFDIGDGALADPTGQALGAAFADIDGDGLEELYVLNADRPEGRTHQADRLFARIGDRWSDLFGFDANQRNRNVTAGRSVAALDRYGQGSYGFLVASYGGAVRLYELSQRHRVVDRAPAAGLAHRAGACGLCVGPLVTPRQDVFIANEQGPNYLFANQGRGAFEELAGPAGVADVLERGRAAGLVDAGDGRFDLVCVNHDGPHRLWRQTAPGVLDDLAPPALAASSPARAVVVADFDNDGAQEIFIPQAGAANRLLARRDGVWQAVSCGDAAAGEAHHLGAVVTDLDGDGRLELLLSQGETGAGPLSLYKARAARANWLRVAPLLPGGAPARGAIVSLVQGERLQRRIIDPGSGYLGQMEPIAHFGLGEGGAADRLAVHWPDGHVRHVTAPPVNQLVRVGHPMAA